MAELQKMERVDLDFAGEYLVLAAKLLKFKSEAVLHKSQQKLEAISQDPLIVQLLEYKRYHDFSQHLGWLFEQESSRFSRPSGLIPEQDQADIYLDEVTLFDLYRQYARFVRETTPARMRPNALLERPIEEYIQLILEALQKGERLSLDQLFQSHKQKEDAISYFLATLELVRSQRAEIEKSKAGFELRSKSSREETQA